MCVTLLLLVSVECIGEGRGMGMLWQGFKYLLVFWQDGDMFQHKLLLSIKLHISSRCRYIYTQAYDGHKSWAVCSPCVRQQRIPNGSSLEVMAIPILSDTQFNFYGEQRRTKNNPQEKKRDGGKMGFLRKYFVFFRVMEILYLE